MRAKCFIYFFPKTGSVFPGRIAIELLFRFREGGRSFGPKFFNMEFLVLLHGLLRWVILVLAVAAIFKSYSGMTAGKPFSAGDKKVGLFLMISAHTTLVVGLILWLFGPWGLANIRNL